MVTLMCSNLAVLSVDEGKALLAAVGEAGVYLNNYLAERTRP
jgi:hypothetical protein